MGAAFLPTLARAVLNGALVPDSAARRGPLALAETTIYLPTQRSARAFARELVRQSGGTSLILPRIAPLGAFEPAHDDLIFEADELQSAAHPAAVSELTRRMVLAKLTRAWGRALRGAICSVDPSGALEFDEREAPLVASSPAQAFALARDLSALIDDMIIEGAAWRSLDAIAPDNFDVYWRITLDFLKIAMAEWPRWLEQNRLIDRAARAALLIADEIAALGSPLRKGPTIIAGSTGTNSATAKLIAAIAGSNLGAVVLPGLDKHLDERAWGMIGGRDSGMEGIAGHPQAALARLLSVIGVSRDAVKDLGEVAPSLKARVGFISEALRPAESTEFWRRKRDKLSAAKIAAGLQGVALIEAEDEVEEALALAIAMREALETAGKTAALITPDAGLAQRVRAELLRWDIHVDDSSGNSLGQTSVGGLSRLVLMAAVMPGPLSYLALLSHPLCRIGRTRALLKPAARALQLGVFHGPSLEADWRDPATLFAKAEARARQRYAHKTLADLTPHDWRQARALFEDVFALLQPLRKLSPSSQLTLFAAAHCDALRMVAASEDGAEPDQGFAEVEAFFDEWAIAAGAAGAFDGALADYSAVFDAALAQQRAPEPVSAHPRLSILGLLEARLLSFDLALAAGLDETNWPPAAQTDAFLNRPMRAALGLSSPERRIGQTAHDFVEALGAREVILSRSKKRGDAPTTPSRFLQRINAVAGDAAYAAMAARGRVYLDLARAIDSPALVSPITRPAPRPALALRPQKLSVSRIETLRRDPYAIFAESILKLIPLEPIGRPLDAREIGEQWHLCLKQFSDSFPIGELPTDIRERWLDIGRRQFAPMLADAAFRCLRWPGIEKGFDFFLAFERRQRAARAISFVEIPGRLKFALADASAFQLSARADRIDFLKDGGANIIDYKTGALPGQKEVIVGFAPQLTLEAAMLARGAFAGAPAREASGALYLKLGGADGGSERPIPGKNARLEDIVSEHYDGLLSLLNQLRNEAAPYLSRPYPKYAKRYGDYDHLARVKEWSATGGLSDGDSEAEE